jgi:glycosyltransferase involved in cell wall biosynthesis
MFGEGSPFFSIILPTFNRVSFLGQAVESVLGQTFSNWELLLVDNNSTDGTDDLLVKFKDKRIKIFKINNGGSISVSRNLGIKAARGKWVAFLDSDDWWKPNKLAECRRNITASVDFIYHDLEIVSGNKKHKNLNCRQLNPPVLIDLLLKGNPIAAPSLVVRKSLLVRIDYMNEDPELIMTADYNTWLKIANITDAFLHVPKKLGFYRIHSNNISNDSILEPALKAMNGFFFHLNDKQKSDVISNLTYTQGRIKFINRNYPKAEEDLVKVVKVGRILNKIKSLFMLVQIRIIILLRKSN